MHVVIGGFGRVGRHLVHTLEAQGHSVAVIDRDSGVFAKHGGGVAGRQLTGEVFDRETLVKAGIERADAFAAVTSGDNSNIVAARVAHERFGVKRVIARIFDPRRAVIYERFGIPTISSVTWAAANMTAMLLEPRQQIFAVYGDGAVITIESDAPPALDGRRIADFERPGEFTVSSLVRAGKAFLPTTDTEIREGDHLYISATRDALGSLKEILDQEWERSCE